MADFDLFQLSEDHEALREAVREVAEARIAPHAAAVDAESRFPQEAYDALRQTDFHAVHLPEEYDGMGADALATCLVIEEVARVCASSSLIPAVNKLGSMPLILGASEDLKARYLPPIAAGEAMISYALSEAAAGSDTASMRCRAVEQADGSFVLDGQKSWITNAGESRFYTVMAVTDPDAARGRGVSAFVVEKDDEGLSFGAPEKKLGIKGSPTRELLFERCRIPGDRIIGSPGEGLKIALRTLDHTRITIGAQAIGIAQGALDFALGYVKERRQFGQAIADFQGIQFMLADMATELALCESWLWRVGAMVDAGGQDFGIEASMLKQRASDAAMRITTDAVQLFGGYGYCSDYRVERLMRDAKITQIWEGTNQVHRQLIGRSFLQK